MLAQVPEDVRTGRVGIGAGGLELEGPVHGTKRRLGVSEMGQGQRALDKDSRVRRRLLPRELHVKARVRRVRFDAGQTGQEERVVGSHLQRFLQRGQRAVFRLCRDEGGHGPGKKRRHGAGAAVREKPPGETGKIPLLRSQRFLAQREHSPRAGTLAEVSSSARCLPPTASANARNQPGGVPVAVCTSQSRAV